MKKLNKWYAHVRLTEKQMEITNEMYIYVIKEIDECYEVEYVKVKYECGTARSKNGTQITVLMWLDI